MDVPAIRGRAEFSGGLCEHAFVKREEPKGKLNYSFFINTCIVFFCLRNRSDLIKKIKFKSSSLQS